MEMTFENAVAAFIRVHDQLPVEPAQPSESESYCKYDKWYLRNCNGFLATVDFEGVVRIDGEAIIPDLPRLTNSNEYSVGTYCISLLRRHSRQFEDFADEFKDLNLSKEEYLNAINEIASEAKEVLDLACMDLRSVADSKDEYADNLAAILNPGVKL